MMEKCQGRSKSLNGENVMKLSGENVRNVYLLHPLGYQLLLTLTVKLVSIIYITTGELLC